MVIKRAHDRCEYCGLAQVGQEATFHIDHVIPVIVGGEATLDNLALACVSCSLRKGARQRALDPVDGIEVDLFNPRLYVWNDHFFWNGPEMVALTPIGRCTIHALQLNRVNALAIPSRSSSADDTLRRVTAPAEALAARATGNARVQESILEVLSRRQLLWHRVAPSVQ